MSASATRLEEALAAREEAVRGFFEREADRLARECHELARAFSRGGTLLVFGPGAATTDAAHVAVEFMHPVIVGKRALPALAVEDAAMVRPGDVAMAFAQRPADREPAGRFLEEARTRGASTIAFDELTPDPAITQEVHETAYHVLWELVHVFFEHPGLLEESCVTCGDRAVEATVVDVRGAAALVEREGAHEEVAVDLVDEVRPGDVLLCHAGVALERVSGSGAAAFLYPFLDRSERDVESVLADVASSALRKAEDVIELRRGIDLDAIERCARDMRERLERGGRVIAFGNGGSSTDAQDLALDLRESGGSAIALNDDVATVTAVGNDVGYDNVFARQLIPLGRAEDVAVGISTSGSSANVLSALEEAGRRGMLRVGLAGYDGGRMADAGLEHLMVARSDYIPRLQEAHATMYHLLLEAL